MSILEGKSYFSITPSSQYQAHVSELQLWGKWSKITILLFHRLILFTLLPQMIQKRGIFTCSICKQLIQTLISILPIDISEVCHTLEETQYSMENVQSPINGRFFLQESINEALKKVCHVMPSFLEYECNIIVDKYSKDIAQLILGGAGATLVCKGITLC